MSDTFSESEIETLHKGAMGAGLLVSVSDRGFFDTFKEAARSPSTSRPHAVARRARS
jgi:hypothetical protein